jgi:hypothetical protein
MRDLPPATDILRIAQKQMRERIVPALPEAERYNGLLIASAMAIVARELAKQAETAAREISERDRLGSLLRLSDAASPDLWRILARRIRQGEFDPVRPGRGQVFALLRSAARADVEVCNPAYLGPAAGG